MSIADAFAPVEARYRDQIMEETWGHLAPEKGRKYPGHIIFAIGCYGDDPLNPTVLQVNFDGLDDSPWFFESLTRFLSDSQVRGEDRERFKVGGVYRFEGSFRNYTFRGRFTRVMAADAVGS